MAYRANIFPKHNVRQTSTCYDLMYVVCSVTMKNDMNKNILLKGAGKGQKDPSIIHSYPRPPPPTPSPYPHLTLQYILSKRKKNFWSLPKLKKISKSSHYFDSNCFKGWSPGVKRGISFQIKIREKFSKYYSTQLL